MNPSITVRLIKTTLNSKALGEAEDTINQAYADGYLLFSTTVVGENIVYFFTKVPPQPQV